MRAAASRTFCTAGTRSAIKMAMMAITTSSSMRVNPRHLRERKSLGIVLLRAMKDRTIGDFAILKTTGNYTTEWLWDRHTLTFLFKYAWAKGMSTGFPENSD